MSRFHPFIVGQIMAALVLYAVAIVWDVAFTGIVLLPAIGSLLGCVICRWRPGLDAPWSTLLPVAAVTNLALLMALVEIATRWRCLLDPQADKGCVFVTIACEVVVICLLLPAGGLLWRWWKRRPGR